MGLLILLLGILDGAWLVHLFYTRNIWEIICWVLVTAVLIVGSIDL